jgi:ferritin-like metal-binding protein YciE
MPEIRSPQDLFNFKLGSALTMENTVLDMLSEAERNVQENEVKEGFRRHQEETRRQITNLEQAFQTVGAQVKREPCPAVQGLQKEAQMNLQNASGPVKDLVVLADDAATEHHEVATYEGLISAARAIGQDGVVSLLQKNLKQEQRMLKQVQQASQKLAQQSASDAG